MSLSGRLEEFSPADLLKIAGSSRSSGRVELTGPGRQGMIFFDNGQVVGAISSAFPADLAALLRGSPLLAPGALDAAQQRYPGEGGGRLFGEFLVDTGVVDPLALEYLVRRQIERIVIDFFPWQKGRFVLEFGSQHNWAAGADNPLQFIPRGGINPELLIEEARRASDAVPPAANLPAACPVPEEPLAAAPPPVAFAAPPPPPSAAPATAFTPSPGPAVSLPIMPAEPSPAVFFAPPPVPSALPAVFPAGDDRAGRPAIPAVPMVFELDPLPAPAAPAPPLPLLSGLVGELRGAAEAGEIYSLVLRCAAWSMRRAVLFEVQGSGLTGWGQIGLEPAGEAADLRVRGIRIPAGEETLFRAVLHGDGALHTVPDPRRPWDGYLFSRLAGGVPTEVFIAPLRSAGRLLAVLYGDNFSAPLPASTANLETFLALAEMRLAMAALERRLAGGGVADREGFRLDFAR